MSKRTIKVDYFLDTVDDIANKPWRAIRYIKELFQENMDIYSGREEYGIECIERFQKIEHFLSNGGMQHIDEFLADKTKNKNYPVYWRNTKEES